MKDFLIPRIAFSDFFWERIGYGKPLTLAQEDACQALYDQADYKTGSLTEHDVRDVSALASAFRPATVCEVGTFVGRSTYALATGMGQGSIWTCDSSNALDLPSPGNAVTIRQFKKTNSTDMFGKAMAEKMRFDLFYIDGRLTQRDAELMGECMDARSIIVLDDFEGVEKGVANASLLLNSVAAGCTLIYPKTGRKTAVLLPFTRIRFVPQA